MLKKKFINFYLSSLRLCAQLQLRKNQPLIIGVTGSAGKSSCTKVIATALSPHFSVKYTKKGNSETGIPLEILGIKVDNYSGLGWGIVLLKAVTKLLFNWEKYQILVVEMGIDSDKAPKNMSTLLGILEPEIGVLLNVNSVHLANYSKPQTTTAIANEKGKLLFNLPENGLAIYNADQAEFKEFGTHIKANISRFSTNTNHNFRLLHYSVSLSGTTFEIMFKGQKHHLHFADQLLAKELFGSLAAAIIVTDHLKIEPSVAIKTLSTNFKILPGRGRLLKGLNGSLIIDGSYNSSLEPTSGALQTLSLIKTKTKRTIAVLGDMRELGENSALDHRQLEKFALTHADLIYTVGPLTYEYFSHPKIRKFMGPYEALAALKTEVKTDDIVLIKGSQNTILLEIVVAGLLANQKDKAKLCRQTPYWEKERAKLKAAAKAA